MFFSSQLFQWQTIPATYCNRFCVHSGPGKWPFPCYECVCGRPWSSGSNNRQYRVGGRYAIIIPDNGATAHIDPGRGKEWKKPRRPRTSGEVEKAFRSTSYCCAEWGFYKAVPTMERVLVHLVRHSPWTVGGWLFLFHLNLFYGPFLFPIYRLAVIF